MKRVLIANRGEIAVRIIRTLRERGIESVAVYSEADATAPHVFMADQAVCLGPAAATESYLSIPKLIAAIAATGADAVHPGYGLLSENPVFAEAVAAVGAVFIGPPPSAMRAMSKKTDARATMIAAGVPVVPGGDIGDIARIGYPVLVKAASGGGGKGMRRVMVPEELEDAVASCQREAAKAFGDDSVYLERLVLRPRHIEIQVLADSHGNVVHLFERECSVQRRHQKVVEESPSPVLTARVRDAMGAAAVAAAKAVGYVNAGTCEFLYDDRDESFYFLEMNTRLQVEHPVTELVTGLDLVSEQLRIAAGEPLGYSQDQLSQRGHAIEVRLYAEDPVTWLPQIGRVETLVWPEGPGIRVDSGIYAGWEVGVNYDPMLAKLCVYAADRPKAVARLRRALAETVVLGVRTNLPLLQHIADSPAYLAGDTTTAFLDEHPFDAKAWVDAMPDAAVIAMALGATGTPAQATPGAAPASSDPYSPWARLSRDATHVRAPAKQETAPGGAS